jgi:hypothetical protein
MNAIDTTVDVDVPVRTDPESRAAVCRTGPLDGLPAFLWAPQRKRLF